MKIRKTMKRKTVTGKSAKLKTSKPKRFKPPGVAIGPGKAKKMRKVSRAKIGLSPNANPHTAINPGNVDPSPAPALRATLPLRGYKHQKMPKISPTAYQGRLLKAHKAPHHAATALFASKIMNNMSDKKK